MPEAGEPARKPKRLNRVCLRQENQQENQSINRICLRQENQQENQRGYTGYVYDRRTSNKSKEDKQDMPKAGESARKPKRLNRICLRHENHQQKQRG